MPPVLTREPEQKQPVRTASTAQRSVQKSDTQGAGSPRRSGNTPGSTTQQILAMQRTVGNRVTASQVLPPFDLSKGRLDLSEDQAKQLGDSGVVDVVLPGLAQGPVAIVRKGVAYSTRSEGHAIALHLPSFAVLDSQAQPVLVVKVQNGQVSGYASLGTPGPATSAQGQALGKAIQKAPELLGWLGVSKLRLPSVTNQLESGALKIAIENAGFTLGGFLEGQASVRLEGNALRFSGSVHISIPGSQNDGKLELTQDKEGVLTGRASLAVQIGGVSGAVVAQLVDGFVSVEGKVAYTGGRLSGSVTLLATDEATARDVTLKKPTDGGLPDLSAEGRSNKPGKRAFAGWGTLNFNLTEWLTGTVDVLVNSKGEATMIGEIAPPKEFILFDQKEWIKNLFKLEIRAPYGIPVVGQVFVFANIGLDAVAKIGPGKLYNIKLQGQYSTDPRVNNALSIQGSINISAFAGLRLRAEGGVGITLLQHDIKAGVGVWALAGVRGYVEATPVIGYRESGGKPEYYLHGSMELAAQLFLGLGGDLFVEIDSPWWSPLPDKKWTWPLGQIEYPLGEFAIGADVDYILGSKQWPEIKFSEAKFDSSKFMTDLMNDNAPKGKGGDKEQPGKWNEGNAGAQPGPKPKGDKGKPKGKPGKKELPSKGQSGSAGGSKGDRKLPGTEQGDVLWPDEIGEKISFSAGGENHSLWVALSGGEASLMMASRLTTIENQLALIEREKSTLDLALQPRVDELLKKAGPQLKTARKYASQLAAAKNKAGAGKSGKKKGSKPSRAELKRVNQLLKKCEQTLAALFAAFFGGAAAGKGPELELLKRLGEERLTQLTDKWEVDVDGCALKNEQNKFVWKGWKFTVRKEAKQSAHSVLQKNRTSLPATETALRRALGEKEGALKNLFQSTAGNKTAEQARSEGTQRAKDEKVRGKIDKVKYSHNAQLGRIEMPGDDQPHTLFEPKDVAFKVPKGEPDSLVISWKNKDAPGSFEAKLGKDRMIQKVEGRGLVLMTGAGHGVTEDSGRFASGKGMNRSHLVANRFGGTGFQIAWGKGAYRNTLNLISASDKYNQNVMKKAEDKIATFVTEYQAAKFNLSVQVTWGQFMDKAAIEAVREKLPELPKAEIEQKLASFLSGTHPKLKRCMAIQYTVTLLDSGGKELANTAPYKNPWSLSIGPDQWLGME